jgi:glycosyltransferase involved in cell wall biosynthesis
MAYYPTDDWPNDTYRLDIRSHLVARLMNSVVSHAARDLVACSSVLLAFNRYMQEEYLGRYRREFTVLMHGDDKSRFQGAQPLRLAETDACWIVATGIFNENRKPLLDDLDKACVDLNARGMKVRVTVFPVNGLAVFSREAGRYRHIGFAPCPDHEELAAVLRGADILFLPERFDKSAEGIRLSVSSKAHLFMFSERPVVVYSDPVTGIARYASEDGWAAVVDRRDPCLLADVIARFITDDRYRQAFIDTARSTAGNNHELTAIRGVFREQITAAVTGKGAHKTI